MPNLIERKIAAYVRKNYPLKLKIVNSSKTPLYNQRCHLNAYEAVQDGRATGIIECVVIGKDNDPVTHFINITSEGNYVDFTLGRYYAGYDYLFVRTVEVDKHTDMVEVLQKAKLSLLEKVVPKWLVNSNLLNNYSFS